MSTNNISFNEEIRNICCGCLFEVLLMSIQNIGFHGKIRNISILSG